MSASVQQIGDKSSQIVEEYADAALPGANPALELLKVDLEPLRSRQESPCSGQERARSGQESQRSYKERARSDEESGRSCLEFAGSYKESACSSSASVRSGPSFCNSHFNFSISQEEREEVKGYAK